MTLTSQYNPDIAEAGVDEAGRGCLAGPVVAAAVILPKGFRAPGLNDSKQVSAEMRLVLRECILDQALAWNVGIISHVRIDQVNILNATYEAMHEAISGLRMKPDALLIDGNRFLRAYPIPYTCMVKGDGRFRNIAAASILAKTFRDEIMGMLHEQFPQYDWRTNKGYGTAAHRNAIERHGVSPFHRKSFQLTRPLTLF